MKLLLVYPPFCTPSIMPYSLVNLYSFLRANSVSVDVLDMNIEFHKEMFSGYTDFFKSFNIENYEKIIKKYDEEAKDCYRVNNKAIVDGRLPELFDELLNKIKEKKPDIVGFSIVYSSQAFYAYALIKELKRSGIKVIVGGPGVNVLL
ncbi:cobalamin-dependent protein, partial [Candidatus Woesearchaeota archaeon]|nr:cobalamin-dependent protein [Candidatus Woesearchaeota archaeon]